MNVRTWEDECLPRLVVRNRERDIALLVLWNLLDDVLPFLPNQEDFPRLSVVGNLRTPLGISWFLRGLGKLSNITTVIVWGEDLGRTGGALLALWQQGVSDGHRVPDFGWSLDPLIDRDSVDRLRSEVTLVDARSLAPEDLVLLMDLQSVGVSRQQLLFPPVEVPDRTVLPSRGGFAQLFAGDPADAWIQIQNLIMACGFERITRKGETLQHLFDVKVVMPVPEIEEIGSPFDFSRDDFEAYYADFISPEPPPSGIDYRYGQRMQNWRNHNQLEELIKRLRKSRDTKRASVVLLDATDLEELHDAPCVSLGTFCIQEGKLSSSWVVRSHDMFSGWPYNVLSLLRVHRMVAERVGVSSLGYASFLSQNAQIYERHLATVQTNLEKWGKTPEDFGEGYRFEADLAGNFIFEVVDGRVRMTMTNPIGDRILLEREHQDPSALIGWVVDSMPWLARQHIRYLGGEEAKLRRALEEGVSYVQG